jgi:phospholipid/cholesterol/gamma-HCH transport system ATP-binding protein
MDAARPPVISVRNLCYDVSESVGGRVRRVLDDVTFDVYEGEIFGVMGLSGSGKSTLLRNIMALAQPVSGDILVRGQNIIGLGEAELNEIRRSMGMCFQYAALFDSLTVADNVAFGLKWHTRLSRQEIAREVEENLRFVGLEGAEDRMPSELSGGMRKRVGIARSLATRPHVMLYDEPSAGLDPVMARVVDELILRLRREFSATSIVVTHDVHELFGLCDRVLMLHDSRVVICDTPDRLRESVNPVVHQFITGSAEGPILV